VNGNKIIDFSSVRYQQRQKKAKVHSLSQLAQIPGKFKFDIIADANGNDIILK